MKLRLKHLFQERTVRPEGPGPHNNHHFPHHGLFSKTGGYKPKVGDFGIFGNPTSDLDQGDEVAEDTDLEQEQLPESAFLNLFNVILEDKASADYLKGINIKDIIKDKKPPVGVDTKVFYQDLNASAAKQAEDGPIFKSDVIKYIERIPFPLDKKETKWVTNIFSQKGERPPEILDYLRYFIEYVRSQNIDINNYKDSDSAVRDLKKWYKTKNQEQNSSSQVVLDFGNGYKILNLDPYDLDEEGNKMGHCASSYRFRVESGDSIIYSLRDKNNEPHVTFELNPKSKTIEQIKGKQNFKPIEKYWPYIFKLIEKLDDYIVLPFITSKDYGEYGEKYRNNFYKNYKNYKNLDRSIKSVIARGTSTPPEALVDLSKDEDWEVRSSVASNPNTPPEVMVELSKDEDSRVRYFASKNPNFPKKESINLNSIQELFKFTQSANDNTSFLRPPHQGSGFPSAYGKAMQSYGQYDPSLSVKKGKKREESIKGRAHQKVTRFNGGKEFAKKDLNIDLNSIQELFIHEKTRADKEGAPEQDIFQYLKQFVNDNPTHFVSFVEVPKLGINPMSKYDTPIGIYCYPLTNQIYNQFKTNSLPFAGDKPYFVLFKASPGTKFFNVQSITEQDFENAKSKLIQMFPNMIQEIERLKSNAKPSGNQTASQLWNITRGLSRNPVKWNATLRSLGYDAAMDLGDGLIHHSEPTQAVFFSFKPINVINIFDNPNKSNKDRGVINFDKLSTRDEEALLRKNDSSIKEMIAKSTKNKETLLKLSKDENWKVRYYVAQHPNTPPEALVELSKDENLRVRYYVAQNPNTPSETLIELSKDKKSDVRSSVALNPKTPPETLVELSKDKDLGVRRYAAQNPNFPKKESINLNSIQELFIHEKTRADKEVVPESAFLNLFNVILEDKASADYLKGINIKDIIKDKKPPVGVDTKAFYQDLNASAAKQAEDGPIFDKHILASIERIPFPLDKKETQWVANIISQKGGSQEIIDYLRHFIEYVRSQNVDINNYKDSDSAVRDLKKWYETKNQEQNSSSQVVLDFGDGYKILNLDPYDLDEEGNKMGHCASGYCYKVESGNSLVYSLRDKNNEPHVTFEIDPKSKTIEQIQGKQNHKPIEKYWPYIFKLIEKLDGHIVIPIILGADYGEYGQKYINNFYKNYKNYKNLTPRIRGFIARSSSTPSEILFELSKDEDWGVRYRVAENPKTPPETLVELSKDENSDVRYYVAGNPKTPPETFVELSKDEDSGVRRYVAQSPKTPPEILVELGKDKDWEVRRYVAQNPKTPPEALIELSKDEDWRVRFYVAKNPNFPKKESINLNSIQELFIHEKIGGRESIERDENDYSTKQPYKNGIPGADKKDIYNSYEKLDAFFKQEEQEDAHNIEKQKEKNVTSDLEEELSKEGADTDYGRVMRTIMKSPQADLGFFDNLNKDNIYSITKPQRRYGKK